MLLGGLIVLAILLPNFIWMARPPVDAPETDSHKSQSRRTIEIIENITRLLVFIIPLFFEPVIETALDYLMIVVMLVTLIFYYSLWIRYFTKGRRYSLLLSSFLGIPVPMAIAPVAYFLAASILMNAILLLACSIIFGVAHIYVNYQNSMKLMDLD